MDTKGKFWASNQASTVSYFQHYSQKNFTLVLTQSWAVISDVGISVSFCLTNILLLASKASKKDRRDSSFNVSKCIKLHLQFYYTTKIEWYPFIVLPMFTWVLLFSFSVLFSFIGRIVSLCWHKDMESKVQKNSPSPFWLTPAILFIVYL